MRKNAHLTHFIQSVNIILIARANNVKSFFHFHQMGGRITVINENNTTYGWSFEKRHVDAIPGIFWPLAIKLKRRIL
jgi:hypothetical protein